MKARTKTALPLTGVAVACAGTAAWASVPGPDGVVHGCYATRTGMAIVNLRTVTYSKGELRAVSDGEACRSYELPVSWSQKGIDARGDLTLVKVGSLT